MLRRICASTGHAYSVTSPTRFRASSPRSFHTVSLKPLIRFRVLRHPPWYALIDVARIRVILTTPRSLARHQESEYHASSRMQTIYHRVCDTIDSLSRRIISRQLFFHSIISIDDGACPALSPPVFPRLCLHSSRDAASQGLSVDGLCTSPLHQASRSVSIGFFSTALRSPDSTKSISIPGFETHLAQSLIRIASVWQSALSGHLILIY